MNNRVLAAIPYGHKNAVQMETLAKMTGLTPRTVRSVIYKARCAGELICSSDGGYFYPSTVEEVANHYAHHRARAIATHKQLKAARAFLKSEGLTPEQIRRKVSDYDYVGRIGE